MCPDEGEPTMASKNKGGREVRKPKQEKKPKSPGTSGAVTELEAKRTKGSPAGK
jgi:hypothetical protein